MADSIFRKKDSVKQMEWKNLESTRRVSYVREITQSEAHGSEDSFHSQLAFFKSGELQHIEML